MQILALRMGIDSYDVVSRRCMRRLNYPGAYLSSRFPPDRSISRLRHAVSDHPSGELRKRARIHTIETYRGLHRPIPPWHPSENTTLFVSQIIQNQ